jgi:hypothetical protein
MIDPPGFTTTCNTVSVLVERSPREVWDLFHNRERWMSSFVARTIVRGDDAEAGALAVVRSCVESVQSERFEETLHSEEGRRAIVRIWAEATPIVAHADFFFEPAAPGCRLTVTIHCWLPQDAAPGAAALSRLTQSKIEQDFQHLKTIAEASSR